MAVAHGQAERAKAAVRVFKHVPQRPAPETSGEGQALAGRRLSCRSDGLCRGPFVDGPEDAQGASTCGKDQVSPAEIRSYEIRRRVRRRRRDDDEKVCVLGKRLQRLRPDVLAADPHIRARGVQVQSLDCLCGG